MPERLNDFPVSNMAKNICLKRVYERFSCGIFFGLPDFRSGWLRKLKHALARFFVEPQSLKDGRAHLDLAALAFVGSLGKFDLGNQLRLYPVGSAGCINFLSKRVFIGFKLLQPLP